MEDNREFFINKIKQMLTSNKFDKEVKGKMTKIGEYHIKNLNIDGDNITYDFYYMVLNLK